MILFQCSLLMLLLAHLIGDFVFQTANWVTKKKNSFWWVFLHALVHALLAYFLIGYWTLWLLPVIIFVSHTVIDFIKYKVKTDNLRSFIVDQLSHLIVITLVIFYYLIPTGVVPLWFAFFPQFAFKVAVILSSVILLTQVGGILIGYFVMPYQQQIKEYYQKLNKQAVEGLVTGGKTIGWLERLLIFVFVLTGQYAGVGFLIAAKSIFRFGELKDSENRKEAEYIIIGTFASFLFALLVSLLTRWIFSL